MVQCPRCHPRHSEGIAEWTAAVQLFLRFAVEQKALLEVQAEFYVNRIRDRFIETLGIQADIQDEADPGDIYIELIRSLLRAETRCAGQHGRPTA